MKLLRGCSRDTISKNSGSLQDNWTESILPSERLQKWYRSPHQERSDILCRCSGLAGKIERTKSMRISEFLMTGVENGQTMRGLCAVLNLNGRQFRRLVEQERRSGIPICSDPVIGYYLAADQHEVARCVRQMRGRANEILTTAAAVEGCSITVGE